MLMRCFLSSMRLLAAILSDSALTTIRPLNPAKPRKTHLAMGETVGRMLHVSFQHLPHQFLIMFIFVL